MISLSKIPGTRPEIIKMSHVIREYEKRGLDYFILHTGRHYSYNMDRIFFEQLRLPEAKYDLEMGSGAHGVQTGRMMAGIEKVLMEEKPEAVLVQGDTNTVLAGALAAAKMNFKGKCWNEKSKTHNRIDFCYDNNTDVLYLATRKGN